MTVLQENVAHLAAWLPSVLIAIGCGASALMALVWRRRRVRLPVSRSLGVMNLAAGWVLGWAIIGLIVAFGPMAPLFRSSARFEGHVGEIAPDALFRRVIDGEEQRLSDFRGKVVVVNLWATWCQPCREELPTLNRLQDLYRGRGLVVLTLSDEERDRIAAFVEARAPSVVNGYMESLGWLDIRDFRPFSLIVDRDGILRDFVFGAQDYSVFERTVLAYLN